MVGGGDGVTKTHAELDRNWNPTACVISWCGMRKWKWHDSTGMTCSRINAPSLSVYVGWWS